MSNLAFLEDFAPESVICEPPVEDPAKSYEQGFADGIAATEAARARADKTTLDDIAQTLSDLEIGYQEARLEVTQALAPLVHDICTCLLPELAAASLAPKLAELIDAAAEQAGTTEVHLRLSEDATNVLEGVELNTKDLILRPYCDPTLSPGQAVITADNSESFLDMPRATAIIAEALGSITDDLSRSDTHG